MAYQPPTSESINFFQAGVLDPFPTVYDAGNSSIAERYTVVWAEYYNKIRNFIGYIEPLCAPNTASNQGLSSLTCWTLNPAPALTDIMYGDAQRAYALSKAPPSSVIPFEIVITSTTDDYSNWASINGGNPPMLYQASQSTIDQITWGGFFQVNPMVQCALKYTNETWGTAGYMVNSYCVAGSSTLLVRGAITNIWGTAVPASSIGLPTLNGSTSQFVNPDQLKLFITFLGARA